MGRRRFRLREYVHPRRPAPPENYGYLRALYCRFKHSFLSLESILGYFSVGPIFFMVRTIIIDETPEDRSRLAHGSLYVIPVAGLHRIQVQVVEAEPRDPRHLRHRLHGRQDRDLLPEAEVACANDLAPYAIGAAHHLNGGVDPGIVLSCSAALLARFLGHHFPLRA